MPNAPLVACAYPGCTRLVVKGRCPEHAKLELRRHGRTADKAFYDSALWKRTRAAKLQRDPLCQYCAARERFVDATVVDHDRPLALGGNRTHPDNLVSCCAHCHNRKSRLEDLGQVFSEPRSPSSALTYDFA